MNRNTAVSLIGAVLLCALLLATQHTTQTTDQAPSTPSVVLASHTYPLAITTRSDLGDWTSPKFMASSSKLDVHWQIGCTSAPQLFFYTLELGLQFTSFDTQGSSLEHVTPGYANYQTVHVELLDPGSCAGTVTLDSVT